MIVKIVLLVVLSAFITEAIMLLQLIRSVSGYRDFWAEGASKPIDSSKVLYVALGDSAAQGIGASSPLKGYVGLVADELATKTGKQVQVINLSVTGAKVQDLIDVQLPKFRKLPINNETVVTVEIGANDMRTFNAQQFAKEMESLISQLPSNAVVSDLPYFGGGRVRHLEVNAIEASKTIKDLASKYQLKVAPLHEVTKKRDNWLVNGADLFHPSNRGYKNWFEAFRQGLDL